MLTVTTQQKSNSKYKDQPPQLIQMNYMRKNFLNILLGMSKLINEQFHLKNLSVCFLPSSLKDVNTDIIRKSGWEKEICASL